MSEFRRGMFAGWGIFLLAYAVVRLPSYIEWLWP